MRIDKEKKMIIYELDDLIEILTNEIGWCKDPRLSWKTGVHITSQCAQAILDQLTTLKEANT